MMKWWVMFMCCCAVLPLLGDGPGGCVLRVRVYPTPGDSIDCYIATQDFVRNDSPILIEDLVGDDLTQYSGVIYNYQNHSTDSLRAAKHVYFFDELRGEHLDQTGGLNASEYNRRNYPMYASTSDEFHFSPKSVHGLKLLEMTHCTNWPGLYFLSDDEIDVMGADVLHNSSFRRDITLLITYCDAKDVPEALLDIATMCMPADGEMSYRFMFEEDVWRKAMGLPIWDHRDCAIGTNYNNIDVYAGWLAFDWRSELDRMIDCRLKNHLKAALVEIDSLMRVTHEKISNEEKKTPAAMNEALLRVLTDNFDLYCSPEYDEVEMNYEHYMSYFDMLREARIVSFRIGLN